MVPYRRAKFQRRNFTNVIADLNSSQKSMNWKCFPFLDIIMGTLSNLRFKTENKGKFKQKINLSL